MTWSPHPVSSLVDCSSTSGMEIASSVGSNRYAPFEPAVIRTFSAPDSHSLSTAFLAILKFITGTPVMAFASCSLGLIRYTP
jgi:hypothetical protein